MTETCFRMKGTTLTSIVLEIIDFDPDVFESQLEAKVASAPQFFTRSSLIIHLQKTLSATEFELLIALCRRLQLQPMAVKGDVAELRPVINDLGLADISQSKTSDSDINTSTDDAANQAEARQTGAKQAEVGKNTGNHNKTSSASQVNYSAPEVEATPVVPVLKPAKVIMRPVRSGQQVYAEGSDLSLIHI